MRHFDVQLIGGVVLHQGKIAEMKTGEGKTLVPTLAAVLNGLPAAASTSSRSTTTSPAATRSGWARSTTSSACRVGIITHDTSYVFEPGYPTTDERLINLRPVHPPRGLRRRHHLRHEQRVRLRLPARQHGRSSSTQRVQRERFFAIVDEVDNILIDEARTPLIISGQAEESADLYFTFARLVPRLQARPEGDEEGGDYFVDLKDKAVSPTEEGIDKMEQLARRREHVRRRPAPRPPLRAGAPGPRALQARPRLHRQGRRDHHRRRVHRPPDARPALDRGPPPGDRGQGGPAGPARVRDPRHDHLPELLPPLRQAGRHDRHGDDRGRGVPQDLQARGRGDPDPPADDPRRLRRTSSTGTRRASSTR